MPEDPELYVLGVIVSDLKEMIRLADDFGFARLAAELRSALSEAERAVRTRRGG